MNSILPAESDRDYEAFAGLIREYVEWLRTLYRDKAWFVDAVMGHQSLDEELGALAHAFGPPRGAAMLARHGDVVQGCGAYRDLGGGVCEMKRVFVPPRWQGRGWGRRLCQALTGAARAQGYTVMRLDSVQRMTRAAALYRSMGFRECAPYQAYPAKILPQMVFMERALDDGAP